MTNTIINGQKVETTNGMVKVVLTYPNGHTVNRNLYASQAQMITKAMVKDGVTVSIG